MRGVHAQKTPPILRLELVPKDSKWSQRFKKMKLFMKHTLCRIMNGGHELYRAKSDSWLGQECLLCGYRTSGWTIDRRDRRLSLLARK